MIRPNFTKLRRELCLAVIGSPKTSSRDRDHAFEILEAERSRQRCSLCESTLSEQEQALRDDVFTCELLLGVLEEDAAATAEIPETAKLLLSVKEQLESHMMTLSPFQTEAGWWLAPFLDRCVSKVRAMHTSRSSSSYATVPGERPAPLPDGGDDLQAIRRQAWNTSIWDHRARPRDRFNALRQLEESYTGERCVICSGKLSEEDIEFRYDMAVHQDVEKILERDLVTIERWPLTAALVLELKTQIEACEEILEVPEDEQWCPPAVLERREQERQHELLRLEVEFQKAKWRAGRKALAG